MDSRCTVSVNAICPILFLGSTAALQLICSTAYLKSRLDCSLVLLFFFVTTGTYLLNRIVDNEDKFNNLKRWQFFNGTTGRFRFWITTAIVLLLSPIVISLLRKKIEIALIFAIISILGFFYSVKLLPWFINKKIKWFSIKNIPILKSLIVCTLWSGGALILAVVGNNINLFRADILIIFLTFFTCCFNSTISSDVRDIEGDRIRRIYTIPVLIGPRNTLKMLTIMNVTLSEAIIVLVLKNAITIEVGIFCCFIILWAELSVLPQYFLPGKVPKTVLEIMVDSVTIVYAICLGIISIN